MSKELVVSSNRHETRVAVLEDDLLTEIYFQRQQEYSLAGSIHKGRVTRVLPGMQSAFVDIGLERDAFLYVSDFFEDNEEYDQVVSSVEEQVLRLEKGQPAAAPVARAPELEPVPSVTAETPEPPKAALAAPPVGGPDRDGRDRRGRRPRRRRGKGRGFPDSKYSSPTAPLEVKSEVGELSEAVELEEEELPMLPGESISKYSPVGQVPDLPEAPQEETESEQVADLPVAALRMPRLELCCRIPEPEIPAEAALEELKLGRFANLPREASRADGSGFGPRPARNLTGDGSWAGRGPAPRRGPRAGPHSHQPHRSFARARRALSSSRFAPCAPQNARRPR